MNERERAKARAYWKDSRAEVMDMMILDTLLELERVLQDELKRLEDAALDRNLIMSLTCIHAVLEDCLTEDPPDPISGRLTARRALRMAVEKLGDSP